MVEIPHDGDPQLVKMLSRADTRQQEEMRGRYEKTLGMTNVRFSRPRML